MRHPDAPDPAFIRRFLAALPPDLAASYSQQQLMGVQRCFGLRHGGRHPLDLRRSVWTPFGRVYVVLLAGRERRDAERRLFDSMLAGGRCLVDVAASAVLASVLLLCGLGLLYAAKLALGIDLVPGIDVLPDEDLLRQLQR
jgi:hypothetical protein